jgi:hypothetical protein
LPAFDREIVIERIAAQGEFAGWKGSACLSIPLPAPLPLVLAT